MPRKIAEETVEEEEYDEESKDLENGGVNIQERAVQIHPPIEFHMSRMQRLSATNPLRLVVENSTRVASPSPLQHPPPRPAPSVSPPPVQQPVPRSSPTPRVSFNIKQIFYLFFCVFLQF